ncbi:MAG TPA: peptidylprolyl isomerase [Gemmataceae bacterium]|nr:peptidylprolyl isomerase [Gemmataceae bacterium]
MKVFPRILTSVAGALILAVGVSAQAPAQKPAAVVNGEAIPHSELEAVIKISTPPSTTPLSEPQKKEIQENCLNLLIEDLLMRQYLRANAPVPTAQEIEKEMQELAASLAVQKKSLPDLLKETGQTDIQLKADIAARLQWKNFISPRLTDQVVKQYYDTNKVFFDKVLVRASHVLLKVAPNAAQADRQVVYNRILAIEAEIKAGKITFQDAAKKYSDCPSKDNGGDIGLFPYKFAVLEPFAKAAFSMKVGDTSGIVPTDFGYHIIKVTDRTQGQPSNFEALKNEVKEIYAQEIYQYIIAEQRKSAKIERN